MLRRQLLIGLFAWAAAGQQMSDDEVWKEFTDWSAALQPVKPGSRKALPDVYTGNLMAKGVSSEEANRRFERVAILRRGSADREKVFWNAVFKLGGGPDAPLRLLQEAIVRVKPGRALEPGMGRGRNAIWLAGLGWDVTGYDMSPDALKVAQTYAETSHVKLKTIESSHDAFDFGDNQWDLILCSYNFMRANDPQWPPKFYKALRPGGIVVWQYAALADTPASSVLTNWKQFRLRRFEDLDAGVIDDDWGPSRTNRTFRLIVQK